MTKQTNDDRCGICDHPEQGHGTRYAAVVGAHAWVPDVPWLRVDEPGALLESSLDRVRGHVGS